MKVSSLSLKEQFYLDSIAFQLGLLKEKESLGEFEDLPKELSDIVKLSRIFPVAQRYRVLKDLDNRLNEILDLNGDLVVLKIREMYQELKKKKGSDPGFGYDAFMGVLNKYFPLKRNVV